MIEFLYLSGALQECSDCPEVSYLLNEFRRSDLEVSSFWSLKHGHVISFMKVISTDNRWIILPTASCVKQYYPTTGESHNMCELLILLILRTCPVSGEAMSSSLWIPACGAVCMPKKPRLSLYDSWAQDWQVPLLYTYSLLLWYPIVRYVKSRMQWGVFLCNMSNTAAYIAISVSPIIGVFIIVQSSSQLYIFTHSISPHCTEIIWLDGALTVVAWLLILVF